MFALKPDIAILIAPALSEAEQEGKEAQTIPSLSRNLQL
jgi:hypothetical protein